MLREVLIVEVWRPLSHLAPLSGKIAAILGRTNTVL